MGTYRYGFNGKENDNEVKGTGNQQDYGFRIYDPRLGRFLSVDPLTPSYPMLTPYQFASNRPIDGIDLDGLEYLPYWKSMYRIQSVPNANTVVRVVYENIPKALRDPQNQTFKFVSGGPVTAWGRDWDESKDGAIVIQSGRYFNNGHSFNGLAEKGKSTNGINSLKGNATKETLGTAQGINSVGGVLGANGLGGIVANYWGIPEQNALSLEKEYRAGFYEATNIVDKINSRNGFGGIRITNEERSSLINFLTDGYLPITNLNQGNNQSNNNTQLSVVEGQLNIANMGVQVLGKTGKLQTKTIELVNGLLQQYQSLGGDVNKFNSMSEYLKTNE